MLPFFWGLLQAGGGEEGGLGRGGGLVDGGLGGHGGVDMLGANKEGFLQ